MDEIITQPETPNLIELAQKSAIPPNKITRNECGLIDNGLVNYQYTSEGLVDWRSMIDPKHLAINKYNFERRGKPVPDSVTGLDDRDLLILLIGLKNLAQTRGFSDVSYSVVSPSQNYVIASCKITWIPNFETEGREVSFSAIGDASPENTNSFGKNYLGPIAENRAFVRAVRNFLKINIVSQEEINTNNPMASDSRTIDPALESMIQVMDANGVTFEKIKATLIKENYPDADKLENLSQIPPTKRFELVGRIKDKAKQKTQK
jgi:hypothetical protein